MFQYETIVDLTDLNDVSFRCKNEDCGRNVTIFKCVMPFPESPVTT